MPRRPMRSRRRYAAESMDIIQESGQAATQPHVVLFNQAWPAALLGAVDQTRRMATTGMRLAAQNDDRFNGAWNHAVLGFLELSLSNYERAHPSSSTPLSGSMLSIPSSPRSSPACRTWSRASSRLVGPTRRRPSASAWRRRRPGGPAMGGRRGGARTGATRRGAGDLEAAAVAAERSVE